MSWARVSRSSMTWGSRPARECPGTSSDSGNDRYHPAIERVVPTRDCELSTRDELVDQRGSLDPLHRKSRLGTHDVCHEIAALRAGRPLAGSPRTPARPDVPGPPRPPPPATARP